MPSYNTRTSTSPNGIVIGKAGGAFNDVDLLKMPFHTELERHLSTAEDPIMIRKNLNQKMVNSDDINPASSHNCESGSIDNDHDANHNAKKSDEQLSSEHLAARSNAELAVRDLLSKIGSVPTPLRGSTGPQRGNSIQNENKLNLNDKSNTDKDQCQKHDHPNIERDTLDKEEIKDIWRDVLLPQDMVNRARELGLITESSDLSYSTSADSSESQSETMNMIKIESFGAGYDQRLFDGWVKQPSACCGAASVAGAFNALKNYQRKDLDAKNFRDLCDILAKNCSKLARSRRERCNRILESCLRCFVDVNLTDINSYCTGILEKEGYFAQSIDDTVKIHDDITKIWESDAGNVKDETPIPITKFMANEKKFPLMLYLEKMAEKYLFSVEERTWTGSLKKNCNQASDSESPSSESDVQKNDLDTKVIYDDRVAETTANTVPEVSVTPAVTTTKTVVPKTQTADIGINKNAILRAIRIICEARLADFQFREEGSLLPKSANLNTNNGNGNSNFNPPLIIPAFQPSNSKANTPNLAVRSPGHRVLRTPRLPPSGAAAAAAVRNMFTPRQVNGNQSNLGTRTRSRNQTPTSNISNNNCIVNSSNSGKKLLKNRKISSNRNVNFNDESETVTVTGVTNENLKHQNENISSTPKARLNYNNINPTPPLTKSTATPKKSTPRKLISKNSTPSIGQAAANSIPPVAPSVTVTQTQTSQSIVKTPRLARNHNVIKTPDLNRLDAHGTPSCKPILFVIRGPTTTSNVTTIQKSDQSQISANLNNNNSESELPGPDPTPEVEVQYPHEATTDEKSEYYLLRAAVELLDEDRFKTEIGELYQKKRAVARLTQFLPGTAEIGNWGIQYGCRKVGLLCNTMVTKTTLETMGRSGSIQTNINSNIKSRFNQHQIQKNSNINGNMAATTISTNIGPSNCNKASAISTSSNPDSVQDAAINKLWELLKCNVGQPKSVLLFHLTNHYALIYSWREYVIRVEGKDGSPSKSRLVREIYTARRNQRPTAWLTVEEVYKIISGWSGYAIMKVSLPQNSDEINNLGQNSSDSEDE